MPNQDIWKDVDRLFERMRTLILKLINSRLGPDGSVDETDLLSQARLALYNACKQYQVERPKMKRETYAYWYLQKHFNAAIDDDRVVYSVYTEDGQYIGTFHGREYARKRKNLPQKHFFRSKTTYVDLLDENNEPMEPEMAVYPEHFDEEDISRIKGRMRDGG